MEEKRPNQLKNYFLSHQILTISIAVFWFIPELRWFCRASQAIGV